MSKKSHIIRRTSTKAFIDVVAPSKKAAIKFIGKKGIYKEASARKTKKHLGIYVFRRKRG